MIFFFIEAAILYGLLSLLNLIEGKPVNERERDGQSAQLVTQEWREGHFIVGKMDAEEEGR